MQELVASLAADIRARLLADPSTPWIVSGLVFALVLLLVLRLFSGRHTLSSPSMHFQVGSAPPMSGFDGPQITEWMPDQSNVQPWDDRRDELLRTLDVAERGVGRFYVVIVALMMAAATGAMAVLYLRAPDDGNRAFLLLYGGVAYVIAMCWLTAQLFSTLRRISPPPDVIAGMRPRIQVTVQNAPQVHSVDNDRLDRAQQALDAGGTLDQACTLIEPQYRAMAGPMQQLFRRAIEGALAERRKNRGG